MLDFLVKAEVALVQGVGTLLLLLSFYAMFRAAANRSLGVGWWTALQGMALTFPDSTYTPVGKKWCRVWRRSAWGFILCLPLSILLVYATVWAFWLLGLPLGEFADFVPHGE